MNRESAKLPIWNPVEDRFTDGTQASRTSEELSRAQTFHEVDQSLELWYNLGSKDPTLIGSATVQSIMMEIAEEREAGRIRPFKEGEPIGMIQKRKPFKSPTETQAQRGERKQAELRTLRAENDRAIARILGVSR